MSVQPDVILGLDQAAKSGWCILAGGRVLDHGVAKSARDIVAVVNVLEALASEDWRRVLVALEDHGTHLFNASAKFKRSPATLLGMGEARGWWVHELARRGHPDPLRVLVRGDDWRMRVLGISGRAGTERCKAEAVEWATPRALHAVADDNEAEAICIAHWASLDGLARNEQRKATARTKARDKRGVAKQLGLPSALVTARKTLGYAP